MPQIKDSMIAAMAVVYGLTVATRNVRDFERTGVVALGNPFTESYKTWTGSC